MLICLRIFKAVVGIETYSSTQINHYNKERLSDSTKKHKIKFLYSKASQVTYCKLELGDLYIHWKHPL